MQVAGFEEQLSGATQGAKFNEMSEQEEEGLVTPPNTPSEPNCEEEAQPIYFKLVILYYNTHYFLLTCCTLYGYTIAHSGENLAAVFRVKSR